MPLVQEKHFWCTNKDKTSVSGQWKETGRTVGVIPDSHPSTLGAALSFQILTIIIPGEKMVVIHPGRLH